MTNERYYILLATGILFFFIYNVLRTKEIDLLKKTWHRIAASLIGSFMIWLTYFLLLQISRSATFLDFTGLYFLIPFSVTGIIIWIGFSSFQNKEKINSIQLLSRSLLLSSTFLITSYLSFSLFFERTHLHLLSVFAACAYTLCVAFLSIRIYQQLQIDQRDPSVKISKPFYAYVAFQISHGIIGSCLTIIESFGLASNPDYFVVEFITLFLLTSTTVIYSEKQYQHKEVQLQTKNEQLRFLAYHDTLTGLFNRTHIKDVMAGLTLSQTPFFVCLIDLDNFKNINDLLGHHAGDQLLIQTAGQLKQSVRDEDVVGRLGGDEFIIIMRNNGEPDEMNEVLENIIKNVTQPMLYRENKISITASMGVASYPSDAQTASELLKNADMAMYQAKKQGKNNFQFYTKSLGKETLHGLQLKNDLKDALSRGELEVYYQPQVEAQSNKVAGFEALLRWNHPTLGPIPPQLFIPAAEESGAIVPIGEWVLRQACTQIKQWNRANNCSLKISVNLSLQQLKNNDFVRSVREILHEVQLESGLLELEITESIAMADVEHSIKIMKELHRLGVKISIDDFGTGYSSLSYLKQFHIDRIKIDRSFVRDIMDDEEDKAIVVAVLSMAEHLNLKTTAEGVEYESQLRFLQQYACHEVQGFLFNRPMSAREAEDLIAKGLTVRKIDQ